MQVDPRGTDQRSTTLDVDEEAPLIAGMEEYEDDQRRMGGVSELDAAVSVAKAIVGAGSFALPWVFKNEGTAGGTISLVVSAVLSSVTMKSLARSKCAVEAKTGRRGLTYVDVARDTLGEAGAVLVFAFTLMASLLVCSSYIAFIGSTVAGMASQDGNIVQALLGPVQQDVVQLAALGVILPICLLRDFRFLTPVVKVGAAAVFAAMGVVLFDGLKTQGGLGETLAAVSAQPLWPASVADYFKSLGSIIYLFAVNFLVLPIERSMAQPGRFGNSVDRAIITTGTGNLLFAILGLSFFGDATQDVVTNNLGNGNVLTGVKSLLVIDLALSYPLVMAAGREILERAVVGSPRSETLSEGVFVGGKRAAVRTGLVAFTFALAHAKGFGLITNIAGGLAQGTLALVVPPWMAVKLGSEKMPVGERAACVALASLGVVVAVLTSYEAILASS